MAKTAAQPKTMESNHKVASVLSTGLFAILCVLIAFPLLAGFFASFQEGREVVMKGMSLNLDFSKMHLDNYKYLFSGNEDSRKYFMWYKKQSDPDTDHSSSDTAGMLLHRIRSDHVQI